MRLELGNDCLSTATPEYIIANTGSDTADAEK